MDEGANRADLDLPAAAPTSVTEATVSSDPELVAAVDLGSNSFHLVVARLEHRTVRILYRIREPDSHATGLDVRKLLSTEMQDRAVACLERFGQRLRDMAPGTVRAVGTSALRQAKDVRPFIERGDAALGHPIEIISGLEEARLIYAGVAMTMVAERSPYETDTRLVVDIGGGSTECILGEGFESKRADSLDMGCVNFTQRFFPDGKLTEAAFEKAGTAARLELQSIVEVYRARGFGQALGASGTILTADAMLREGGHADEAVTLRGVRRLIKGLCQIGTVQGLTLPGLKPDRAPQLAGGLSILEAVLYCLSVDRMSVSAGALREGVLHDLCGRIRHEDVREQTVSAMMRRYHVERPQAERVERTAREMQDQVAAAWELGDVSARQSLSWAARLHEIGLSVSYTGYHKHSAYLVTHAEMPGFSRDDQVFLAAVLRGHRRKLDRDLFGDVPKARLTTALRLCVLLRLAARLERGRSRTPLPKILVTAVKGRLGLEFPAGFLDQHPLTRADLDDEATALATVGISLRSV